MADKKRVGCFYRVSTKGQLENDDIPMQRRACQEFVDKQGWEIVNEYIEKGVSGYKTSAIDRDEIQRAKKDAESKKYDILLCFMFDRLGRKDDETPFILKWFSKQGIELWSVKEGQQKFEDHTDDLINYIRFWQSSGESKKTSMRVDEDHKQMVKDGMFRGGQAPYGYKLVKSGIENKKGKELFKLEINQDESEVVKNIFNLVYEKGYGGNRITRYLNENNIKSSTNSKWNTGVVNYLLRNPIYKGYMTYGKKKSINGERHAMQIRDLWILSENQNAEITIVDENIWDKVQEIRSSRTPQKVKNNDINRINLTKSPLLLVGKIKCGHCNSPMTTTYNYKSYKNVKGEVTKYKKAKYRCSGKALNKTECDGQTIYAQNKVENTVLDEIDLYFNKLKEIDFSNEINKNESLYLSQELKEIRKSKANLNTMEDELKTLSNEVARSLAGKSKFNPELLSRLINDKEQEIKALTNSINEKENKIQDSTKNKKETKQFQKFIPRWRNIFNEMDYNQRKVFLSYIVGSIVVYRESIETTFNLNVESIIQLVGENN